MTDTLASASFRYALRRVAIFPLAPGSKCPIKGSHGLRDATDDPDATRVRWQRSPQANIGAATGARSGFWVLDVDLPDGPESLAALEAEHGPLPVCAHARPRTLLYFVILSMCHHPSPRLEKLIS